MSDPTEHPYRCQCGTVSTVVRGNADPPLPWPDRVTCWHCGSKALPATPTPEEQ